MRRLLLVLLGLFVAIAGTVLCQGDLFHDLPPLVHAEERVAYSVDPPRKISVEISNAYLEISLRYGSMSLWAPYFEAPGTRDSVSMSFSSFFGHPVDMHGTYPGATFYQVRPSKDAKVAWQNFALQIDVPKLEHGTPIGLGVCIIPAAQFGSLPMPSEKFAITPAPTVEIVEWLKQPDIAEITFPSLSVEWIEWSQTARYRVGNVVLNGNVYWRWDETNPNAIHIGNFLIDLVSGVARYCGISPVQTDYVCQQILPFPVIIDDGDSNAIYWEPDLWW